MCGPPTESPRQALYLQVQGTLSAVMALYPERCGMAIPWRQRMTATTPTDAGHAPLPLSASGDGRRVRAASGAIARRYRRRR
jgi:hypothetical protein